MARCIDCRAVRNSEIRYSRVRRRRTQPPRKRTNPGYNDCRSRLPTNLRAAARVFGQQTKCTQRHRHCHWSHLARAIPCGPERDHRLRCIHAISPRPVAKDHHEMKLLNEVERRTAQAKQDELARARPGAEDLQWRQKVEENLDRRMGEQENKTDQRLQTVESDAERRHKSNYVLTGLFILATVAASVVAANCCRQNPALVVRGSNEAKAGHHLSSRPCCQAQNLTR